MKNNNFRPSQHEVDSVTKSARKDGFRGGALGALATGILARRAGLNGAGVAGSAAIGALAGNVLGKKIGRRNAAKDDIASRKALRQLTMLRDKITELESRIRTVDPMGNVLVGQGLSGQNHNPKYRRITGSVGIAGLGRSASDEFYLTQERQRLAQIYGWGVINALDDDQLTEEHCKALHDEIVAKMAKVNGPHASHEDQKQFEKAYLQSKIGDAVHNMSAAEVHAIYLGHARRGLVELNDTQETTHFGILERFRSQSGEFLPNGAVNSADIQKAYSPSSRSGRHAVGAGLLGAAAVGATLLRKGKRVPRLNSKTIDVSAKSHFGALHVYSPEIEALPHRKPSREDLTKMGVNPKLSLREMRKATLERLKQMTMLSRKFNFGVGSVVAEGVVDALGLGSATAKKKKKLVLDKDGNPYNPTFLPDFGTGSPGDENSAANQFSAISTVGRKLGSTAGRYLPEAATIAGADLVAERANAAIESRKKRMRKRNISGGIEVTPGMGGMATTLASINDVLTEFTIGSERNKKAKKAGAVVGAGTAGAIAGGVAGLKYDQGSPTKHSDLKPGDRVYRRFGPGKIFQHSGTVDESGGIVHRTSGSSKYRSVKPSTFGKVGGRGPTFKERSSSDLPRKQAAQNATRATGSTAGKYGCIGNSCQSASERISTKSRLPIGGQVKRAAIGALGGAIIAGSAAHILANRKKGNK